PELLSGHSSYSQATDIYAFGMIMWEITSDEKPFHDFNHDKVLALQICKGLRPEITKDTPQFYRDLMKRCWRADPTQRPTAQVIEGVSNQFYDEEIDNAEEIRRRNIGTKKETSAQHPGA